MTSTPMLERAGLAAVAPETLGRVTEVLGLQMRVSGLHVPVGDLVRVDAGPDGGEAVLAEVVAASDRSLVCLPLGNTAGLSAGQWVHATGAPLRVPVGPALLGRVLDGFGRPIDGGAALDGAISAGDLEVVSVVNNAPNPLSRKRIDTQLGLGVRSLDTLVPVGRGQRIGIMAGSGVGKSSLLSMIARGTDAQVSVIALVGERGREVREFIENDLGPEGLARSVVVVATSDAPPVERMRAGFVATRIAESFRDSGLDVVLMLDSLTRMSMAQREIGLSAGEPPATRGYPPSVFSLMPMLLERAGCSERGSITGIYTVLIEGDDLQDPIGDTARSILDGHIVLERRLATAGHFPAVDVLESISRLTGAVTHGQQRTDARAMRAMLAAQRDVAELVEIGAYVPGTNPEADRALDRRDRIDAFLRQDMDERDDLATSWAKLAEVVGP